jgi:malonyl-ACP decarboxylase
VRTELVMTGLGVTTPIGIGRESFVQGLFEGRHAFGLMRRPGRQKDTAFMGAELPELERPAHVSERLWRGVSLTSHAALITVSEAWDDAQLNGVDPQRIGLIVGGTNLQQREQVLTHERSAGRLSFLRPSYALTFMDTDVCAACTALSNFQSVPARIQSVVLPPAASLRSSRRSRRSRAAIWMFVSRSGR